MSKSIVYELELKERTVQTTVEQSRFSKRQALGLLFIVATILLNVYGIFSFGWSFNEMSANFILAGLLAALLVVWA